MLRVPKSPPAHIHNHREERTPSCACCLCAATHLRRAASSRSYMTGTPLFCGCSSAHSRPRFSSNGNACRPRQRRRQQLKLQAYQLSVGGSLMSSAGSGPKACRGETLDAFLSSLYTSCTRYHTRQLCTKGGTRFPKKSAKYYLSVTS